MNKKNFTLSAFVLMLFFTAFISNANASVGSFNDDGAEAQENDVTDEQFHINAADNEDAVLYRRFAVFAMIMRQPMQESLWMLPKHYV